MKMAGTVSAVAVAVAMAMAMAMAIAIAIAIEIAIAIAMGAHMPFHTLHIPSAYVYTCLTLLYD